MIPAVVGTGVGAATVLGSLPPYCGWLAPAAMLTGFLLTLKYERWVRDHRIVTVWGRVVETVRYYPWPSRSTRSAPGGGP
ncbi:hypothetical protein [Methanopyrus kandleri]|uniref:Uncharacterized protein n=2 Tax=Methanopyrus kandleri TaxID=2320 RepID=Q8TW96_METKA|nr:hypothetical protein [Methanopyrus kandleri]AAM02353.1 Uncharacterized protein MK1140 [Methanopyrus kandleri AV19]HII69776.1 hypothetical protein [Methanopyrus kandleri]